MYGRYLRGILMIFLNHRLTSQITHRYNMVCIVHTILLNRIDIRIHITTATIIIRSMNMDYQGLPLTFTREYPPDKSTSRAHG